VQFMIISTLAPEGKRDVADVMDEKLARWKEMPFSRQRERR